jgi:hypothetical protein
MQRRTVNSSSGLRSRRDYSRPGSATTRLITFFPSSHIERHRVVGVPSGRKSDIWAALRFATIPDLVNGISVRSGIARLAAVSHLVTRSNADGAAV